MVTHEPKRGDWVGRTNRVVRVVPDKAAGIGGVLGAAFDSPDHLDTWSRPRTSIPRSRLYRRLTTTLVEDPVPRSIRRPSAQARVAVVQAPATLRHVMPMRTGADPQDRVDHLTMSASPATLATTRQVRPDPLQRRSRHSPHQSNTKDTPPRSSRIVAMTPRPCRPTARPWPNVAA
jgi:hypothetical protein